MIQFQKAAAADLLTCRPTNNVKRRHNCKVHPAVDQLPLVQLCWQSFKTCTCAFIGLGNFAISLLAVLHFITRRARCSGLSRDLCNAADAGNVPRPRRSDDATPYNEFVCSNRTMRRHTNVLVLRKSFQNLMAIYLSPRCSFFLVGFFLPSISCSRNSFVYVYGLFINAELTITV